MSSLYGAITRSAWINRQVHRQHGLLSTLEQLPVPVTFPEGPRRIAPYRLLRLVASWAPYAEETRRSAAMYAGGDVIDVGAYHGYYSLLLAPRARAGDRIVSLEPDRAAFPDLVRNLGACSQVFTDAELVPLPFAAGDGRPVTVTYPEGSGHPRYESSGASAGHGTMTVDGLVEELALRPSFLKIDVEGAESRVLRGAERTLERLRPALMLEVHPQWQPEGVSTDAVEAMVADLGYRREASDASELAVRQWWRPAG